MRSDAALDRKEPATALAYRPHNPEALLKLASDRLAKRDIPGSERLAGEMLRFSPADGRAYRLLAQIAEGRRDEKTALELYRIAARRAPRDLQARAWLAQHGLASGDYDGALEHIDSVLRMSFGSSSSRVFPVLTKLAQDKVFAEALGKALSRHPPWRQGMLTELLDAKNADSPAADQVLAALRQRDDLDPATSQLWIESLIQRGRWGEAFARWAAPIVAEGSRLPLLFNGDFASDPQGSGFDWRILPTAGAMLSVEPDARVGMLHIRFLGRRVSGGALARHALVLAPGSYELSWKERMEALRAGAGLTWRITCADEAEPLAQALPEEGTRPWRSVRLAFTVPATGCSAQWLQLASTGDGTSGQIVSGDVWYSGMDVTRKGHN